ncbi:MAG: helix-turn-helix domain-containing protein [Silvanigrellaceae bacterium]
MGERVVNTPADIIGLTGELTLENVHQCYRKTRDRLLQGGTKSELDVEELDWAYRALLTEIEQSTVNDSEDCVVSALLLPQLTGESILNLEDDDNVFYLKRNGASQGNMQSAPMSALDLPELKGAFTGQKSGATAGHGQRNVTRDYRNTSEPLDAVTPVRSGEPSAYQPPRRLKTLVGEGDKDVVDVCARAAMQSDAVGMMNNIIDSAEQITGSLLKKLREEMGVDVEEMSVRTKIPRKYLIAIESDRYEQLPAAVYFRGFLVSYLRYLNLKREDIIDAITENYRSRLRIQSRTRKP